jgi:hypothetical protein
MAKNRHKVVGMRIISYNVNDLSKKPTWQLNLDCGHIRVLKAWHGSLFMGLYA